MSSDFSLALAKASQTTELNLQDIISLISGTKAETRRLFALADEIRRKNMGDIVHLRGIIEISNYCRQNCHYCGLRRDNRGLDRYRLTQDEILLAAEAAIGQGYKTLVLQAGEDSHFTPAQIADLIVALKKLKVAITLSLGEFDEAAYRLWRQAGADRYLLKHETADPDLYGQVHPGKTLAARLNCQQSLKKLGYQLGSGFMVGLPGQTLEIFAQDLLLLKQFDVEMAGIGPFIPHPTTPLAKAETGSSLLTLKMLALARILMPQILLPATTALSTIDQEGMELALQVGANVVMPNVGPCKYRELYQIYPNKACLKDDPATQMNVRSRIEALGKTVGTDYGHSPRFRDF